MYLWNFVIHISVFVYFSFIHVIVNKHFVNLKMCSSDWISVQGQLKVINEIVITCSFWCMHVNTTDKQKSWKAEEEKKLGGGG